MRNQRDGRRRNDGGRYNPNYPPQMPGNDQRALKRKKKTKRRIILFIIEILVLLIAAAALFIYAKFSKIERNEIKKEDIIVNPTIDQGEISVMKGYTNIALFGVDSRQGALESGTNSDTIMICSINNDTKEVKLVSVYRDSYLDNTTGNFQKATEVYAVGGAKQAIDMLNKNLDLNITDYVTVNFDAVVEMVDLFDGVDIELTDGEVKWLNGYLKEGREVVGKDTPDVPGSGMQHLNGMQALAYSRIRYIGLDYERTERQRKVLSQVMEKAKSADLLTLNKAVDTMLPMISTSMSATEILGMATDVASYNIGETQGFPFEKTTANVDAGDCVIPVNMEQNVLELHKFLFGSDGYQPSETVKEISSQIVNNTGIQ